MATITTQRLTPSGVWTFLNMLNVAEPVIDNALARAKAFIDTDIIPGVKVLSRARANAEPALFIQLTIVDTIGIVEAS